MIKLTCIREIEGVFTKGEDYKLLQRRGSEFVEVINSISGREVDFILIPQFGMIGYRFLDNYFNLVPANKRMVFFEKINHICNFND